MLFIVIISKKQIKFFVLDQILKFQRHYVCRNGLQSNNNTNINKIKKKYRLFNAEKFYNIFRENCENTS